MKSIQTIHLEDTKILEISPKTLFAALQNVKMLEKLVPGCKYIEKTKYKKSISEVLVNLENRECIFLNEHWTADIEPNSKITVSITGNSGPAGRFTANLNIIITPEEDTTNFFYTVNATFYLKNVVLTKVNLESTAKQLMEMFINNLQQQYTRKTAKTFGLFLAVKTLINKFYN